LLQIHKHQRTFGAYDRGILKRVAVVARGTIRVHVVAAKRAVKTVNTSNLIVQYCIGALLAVGVFVIKERRPARERFVQQRLAGRIVSNGSAPPLMRDEMRYGP